MPCTTILVGSKASYDRSTMVARNEDSGAGSFAPKKFCVGLDFPTVYHSVLSKQEIALPPTGLRCTLMPNAVEDEGIWGAAGVNEENVAMTATETITSNERVQAADPLRHKAEDGGDVGGIGEEDMVSLVLPYIHSAREGVKRLGALLAQYGTYEMNGIAFQDYREIWWLETVGGHHYIARRVPDDAYVLMPNCLGIDYFDLTDAMGEGREYLCSPDLPDFINRHHLAVIKNNKFNPRRAFGSHSDADHVYNTPRAWYGMRYFNRHSHRWDGPDAQYTPDSDDIPWCMVPEHLITPEDIKYVLSSHYQGTIYDPYARHGDSAMRGAYRPIGVNRNNFISLTQLRPYVTAAWRALEWVAFGSNVFNAFVPLYANITSVPTYLSNTTGQVDTHNFYWANRLIGTLADRVFAETVADIERYQHAIPAMAMQRIEITDEKLRLAGEREGMTMREQTNAEIVDILREQTDKLLKTVLDKAGNAMTNAYARSDG